MKDQHLIYGEITIKGIYQFAELEPKVNNFMDIGSGYGKFPWVMKYFFNYKNCYGIEIDKEKFKFSIKHFKTFKDNEVVYKYGHFNIYESLIKKMDVIYCNCVAWPLEMVEELYEMLENCVFYHNNTSFAFKYINIHSGRVSIDMSWSNGVDNYYKLNTNTNR